MENTLYILDGHGLIYRAYYAFINRPLVTTKGENTSAIFGFMRMLLRLMQDEEPRYLVCAFDPRGKTFRHERFPEYKAKRMKAPEDLHVQGELIKNIVGKLGIARIEVEGFEADDVIGTLTRQASARGMRSVVLSGDKDILQLIDESVSVYTSKRGISEIEVLNREGVETLWGVSPSQMVDLLALMGDQSDNIPGIRGIGKITAVKLIQQFGSLDGIYEHIEEIDMERTKQLLREGREDALLSRELVTIRRDAPVTFDPETFRIDAFPKEEGISILSEKELGSIVADLKGTESEASASQQREEPKRGTYRTVDTIEEFGKIEKKIREVRLALQNSEIDPGPWKTHIVSMIEVLEFVSNWFNEHG